MHVKPVALGPLAKRRVFDYIRGAYDLGYNDARNAKAVPGDNAPGYQGRDVEADHGGALLNALKVTLQPATHGEPVAKVCHGFEGHIGWNPKLTNLPEDGTYLYTSPPEHIKVMEQALKALTATMATHGKSEWIEEAKDEAITALQNALSQPRQAPII